MEPSILEELLNSIHSELIQSLLARIKSGDATSADLALAWKVLEDNGVPLADLRKKAGGNEKAARDEEFLGSLPFPGVAKSA